MKELPTYTSDFEEYIRQGESRTDVGINVGIKEQAILRLIVANPSISADKMGKELGITARQVERLIATLKQKKLLQRIGANKNGHWEIIE